MNGTFCIDKRIGYLALFAVPLMILTIFSLMVNSQKITQNSRAETPVAIPVVTILSPTPAPSSTCLSIVEGELSIPESVNNNQPLQIYGLKENRVVYLALLDLSATRKYTPTKGYEAYLAVQGTKYPISADFEPCPR